MSLTGLVRHTGRPPFPQPTPDTAAGSATTRPPAARPSPAGGWNAVHGDGKRHPTRSRPPGLGGSVRRGQGLPALALPLKTLRARVA